MRYKVGDKVKFLNEEGGGTVSKIISPSMVQVLIDDGFELPTMIQDIIPADFGEQMELDNATTTHSASNAEIVKQETFIDQIRLQDNRSKGTFQAGIYFAFVPHDQNFVTIGNLDLYIVNNSDHDLLYTFYLKEENEYMTKSFGQVEARSMYMIDTVTRDKLNTYLRGVVQGIFLNAANSKTIWSPVNTDFAIKPQFFMKESNFKHSGIIDSKALFVSLLPFSLTQAIFSLEQKTTEKIDVNEVIQSKSKLVQAEQLIQKYKTGPREAVVDLHLSELVEDESKMSDHEKLNIQIDHFKACLDSAIANYYTKVTFIHGVGQGILKENIRKIITEYPKVVYRDASMKEYGYGATLALIRHN
jgi:hypothetical protein